MQTRESYCILCGEKRGGVDVREDAVLQAMRWFKKEVLRKPVRKNRLVVCSSCYPGYKEQRKKYLSRQRTYLVLGVLFMVFGIVIAGLRALPLSIGILLLLYLLSLLNYMPDLEIRQGKAKKRK